MIGRLQETYPMWIKLTAIAIDRPRWTPEAPRALDDVEVLEHVGVQEPTGRPEGVTDQGEWTFPITINTSTVREIYPRKIDAAQVGSRTPGTRIVYDNGSAQVVTADYEALETLLHDKDGGVFEVEEPEEAGDDEE